jgi:hypothetical protein
MVRTTLSAIVLTLLSIQGVVYAATEVVAPLGAAVEIDGRNAEGEWKDAQIISVDSGGLKGVIGLKNDGKYLYMLLEFLSDTVRNPRGWDNGWVALDLNRNGGTSYDSSDWLIHSAGHNIYTGDGQTWKSEAGHNVTEHAHGVIAGWTSAGAFGPSSFSSQSHTVFEFKIPLAILEDRKTIGFGAMVQDADGKKILEWPAAGGATPEFWPGPEFPQGQFSAPSSWGVLAISTSALSGTAPDFTPFAIVGAIAVVAVIVGAVMLRRRSSVKTAGGPSS